MKTLLSTILFCSTLFSLTAQNVKFHEQLDNFSQQIKDIDKFVERAIDDIKKPDKNKALAECQDYLLNAAKDLGKAVESAEKAKKFLKKAKNEAKAWGCNETTEKMGILDDQLNALTNALEKAAKEVEKSAKQDKVKKIVKDTDELKGLCENAFDKTKVIKKQTKVVSESCN